MRRRETNLNEIRRLTQKRADDNMKQEINEGLSGAPPNIIKRDDGKYYLDLQLKLAITKRKDKPERETCIEALIFPHEEVITKCLSDLRGIDLFDNFKHNNMPIITTTNRIRHF